MARQLSVDAPSSRVIPTLDPSLLHNPPSSINLSHLYYRASNQEDRAGGAADRATSAADQVGTVRSWILGDKHGRREVCSVVVRLERHWQRRMSGQKQRRAADLPLRSM
jgi:hypothetical protein